MRQTSSNPGRETYPPSPDRYPTGLLRHTRAQHALLIHYEDFFTPVVDDGGAPQVRLLPTLQGRVPEYIRAVAAGIARPRPGHCTVRVGLCGDSFTLPLPGAWLVYDTASSATNSP